MQNIEFGLLKGSLTKEILGGMQMSTMQIPFGEYTLCINASFQQEGLQKTKTLTLTLSNLSVFKGEEDITFDVFNQSIVINTPKNLLVATKFLTDKI